MKLVVVAIAVVAIAAVAASPAAAASIEGTVREAGTRRPVPAVVVEVLGSDVVATSDDQGAFVLEFQDTRVTAATLAVDTGGYEKAVVHVSLSRDATTSVDIYLVPTETGETRVRE